MALKKLKMNQKKNFNVCLERVVPVSKNSIIYKQSIVLLVWISDWPASILFPPYRRRELQQLVEPEASPSTRMRQACLNMADSSRSFYKSYHEFHWTIPPPSCSVLARERWRRGGGARPDSDVPHVQLPDEPSRRGCRALCSPGCHGCQWLLWPICQNVSRAGWVYVDCKCMTPEMAQM